MSSKVLIGITSKNRFSLLPKSIESAIGQEYANKVVSVYDDNSNDRTPELEMVYPNVKWVFFKRRKGLPVCTEHVPANNGCRLLLQPG